MLYLIAMLIGKLVLLCILCWVIVRMILWMKDVLNGDHDDFYGY